MNPLVAEYRSLPPSTDHLPDDGLNSRKREILFALDEQANDPDVSQLLLDVLRDPLEFDLARVEAIRVAGVYINVDNPLYEHFWAELQRLARSEDEMLQNWALLYIELREERGDA